MSNCTGTIKLKNLWFKRLIFEDARQTDCVVLQDTRIFHVIVRGVVIGSDVIFSRKQKAHTLRSEDFERELQNKLLTQKIQKTSLDAEEMCLSQSQHLSEFLSEIDAELSNVMSQTCSPRASAAMLKSM